MWEPLEFKCGQATPQLTLLSLAGCLTSSMVQNAAWGACQLLPSWSGVPVPSTLWQVLLLWHFSVPCCQHIPHTSHCLRTACHPVLLLQCLKFRPRFERKIIILKLLHSLTVSKCSWRAEPPGQHLQGFPAAKSSSWHQQLLIHGEPGSYMGWLVGAKLNKWAVLEGKPRGATVWRRPCPHAPAFHVAKITFLVVTNVFPVTGAWVSILPSESHLIFHSHQAAPPAPRCHKGARSQNIEELVPKWSPCSTCLTACVSPPCLQYISVAGEPTSTWVSSLLPMETPAAPGKDSQHPADLARESLKAVSNTNGSFAPAKMQCSVIAKVTGIALRTGFWACDLLCDTRVCAEKPMSKECCQGVGLHQCYLPTPLGKGTGKERTGFLVKVLGGNAWLGETSAWSMPSVLRSSQRQGRAMGELPLEEGLLSCMESSWGTQEWWGHS